MLSYGQSHLPPPGPSPGADLDSVARSRNRNEHVPELRKCCHAMGRQKINKREVSPVAFGRQTLPSENKACDYTWRQMFTPATLVSGLEKINSR